MKPYRTHLFVCQGKNCSAKGSEEIYEILKGRVKSDGPKDVKVSKSGCLSVCKETEPNGELCPALVVYPEGVWYRNVTKEDIDEIYEKVLKKGETVERLIHYKLPR